MKRAELVEELTMWGNNLHQTIGFFDLVGKSHLKELAVSLANGILLSAMLIKDGKQDEKLAVELEKIRSMYEGLDLQADHLKKLITITCMHLRNGVKT